MGLIRAVERANVVRVRKPMNMALEESIDHAVEQGQYCRSKLFARERGMIRSQTGGSGDKGR